ncbi:LacI family DNA-binding transcriptional regulator [Cryptosporangium aurantiacum]|uniref:Transcriptional regulator, LacI family n=1 Tax=Cryptosporangium aurantiacum TaxID=134849 RepID=A0A1M7RBG2_9ACTN|nr:LacI family DNA-binding transcriptional regulator [Cryptosporangium aurantiacum]SHN43624.1 transcriptional regulator, LacI family [Cryptosporangium aurantiacum]
MKAQVRLKDVAEAAATSTKTASRVINGDPRVAEETRARILAAVRDLGYRPDPTARSLRKGTDDTLGIVVDSIADPFFAAVTGTIERLAIARGLRVMIASTGRDPRIEATVVDDLLARRVAGLIVAPTASDHSYLAHAPCPVLFVDRRPDGLDGETVLVDDNDGARRAVAHLAARGHRRVGYVGGKMDVATTRNRLQGYRDEVAASGLQADESLVRIGRNTADEGRAATLELLALPEPPTAIFSSNTRCSLGVVAALHACERTDVALVCFGDFPLADVLAPGVTVIDHDPLAIGQLAAETMFERLAGAPATGRDLTLPLRLIPRGSGEQPVPT